MTTRELLSDAARRILENSRRIRSSTIEIVLHPSRARIIEAIIEAYPYWTLDEVMRELHKRVGLI